MHHSVCERWNDIIGQNRHGRGASGKTIIDSYMVWGKRTASAAIVHMQSDRVQTIIDAVTEKQTRKEHTNRNSNQCPPLDRWCARIRAAPP